MVLERVANPSLVYPSSGFESLTLRQYFLYYEVNMNYVEEYNLKTLKLKDITEIRVKLLADVYEVDAELDRRKSETLVQCTHNFIYGDGCGSAFPVKDLTYIQTHHYVSPHGCSGGDYWNESEGQFICPECGHRNRLYDRPDIEALKRHFKDVKDVHED